MRNSFVDCIRSVSAVFGMQSWREKIDQPYQPKGARLTPERVFPNDFNRAVSTPVCYIVAEMGFRQLVWFWCPFDVENGRLRIASMHEI